MLHLNNFIAPVRDRLMGKSLSNGFGAVESIAYGYDQLDRLTLACAWNFSTNSCVSGQFNQSFRYDKLGNILTKAGTNYTYGSSKPHAVTAAGANSYTYDTNGNMLTGAGRTFTWNGENQPVQIAKTGTPTESYVYDGDNVRIKRTVTSSPAVTSIYVGKVEYRGTQVISTYGGVASRTTTGTPTSSNLGTIVYMHTDHLGSVSMTTSATGTVAQTQEFDPWGAVKAGGITSVSYNYTGQRLDGTGLLFYNARYYDSQLARFTSADSIVPGFAPGSGGAAAALGPNDRVALRPLTVDFHEAKFVEAYNYELKFTAAYGFHFQLSKELLKEEKYQWGPQDSQALNRYAYVLNNPLRYVDPSGHSQKDWQDWRDRAARAVLIWADIWMLLGEWLYNEVMKAIEEGETITETLLIAKINGSSFSPAAKVLLRHLVGGLIMLAGGAAENITFAVFTLFFAWIVQQAAVQTANIWTTYWWGCGWGDYSCAPPGRAGLPPGPDWDLAWVLAK